MSNNLCDSDDFYNTLLNSLVYFIRNIKFDATIEEIEKLLYYKEVDNKKYILEYFKWTEDEFNKINKYQLAKIFEYLSALELSIIYGKFILPYDLLSIDFKDSLLMPTIDIGLDLISLDKTYAAQCKHYLKGSTISSHCIQRSDYCCLRINRDTGILLQLEFITPSEVKFSTKFINFVPNHKILNFEILRKWLYYLPLKNNSNNNEKIIGFEEDINIKCNNFVWRDCQKGAINHIFNRLFYNDKNTYDDNNIYINMVCGSGKTSIVSGFLNYYLKKYKILILVPRLLLLEQFTKVLDYWELDYNCVGTGYNETINKNICLCVYNSIDKVKDLDWNYLFIDEAHHIEKRLSNKKTNIVNTDNNIDNDDNDSNNDSDDEYDNAINDDNNKYLDIIATLTKTIQSIFFSASLKRCDFNYDLRSAINDDVLVDYQLHIPIYYNGTFEENVVKYIIQNPVYSSMIAFCNSINDCIKYKDLLLNNNISCDYITSNQSKKERNIIMDNFKNGKIRVLLSVRILCEGIDIPSCNSVMFVDERYSEIEVLQCMLRCTRKYKNKKLSHIILPPTYKDEMDNKMINVIIKIAKGDSKLYNILKEGKRSNQIKVNIINDDNNDSSDCDDNNSDSDNEDEKYNEKDIYDIIYDSSMRIINGSNYIERIKKEILLYKQFHNENGRFIYQKEKAIINGYNISGQRLSDINKKIKKLEELIIFIQNNYIELYNRYIHNKEKIDIDIKEELLLYKQFYDKYNRFMKQRPNEKYVIKGYTISGNRLDTIKQKYLKNLDENDELIIFIKNNFIELYNWYISNKTKEKKEKINIDIKEEILLYKQFHDNNNRFIKFDEKTVINGYNISGNRLDTIKQKIKKLEENDELIIFIKNNFIELYDWYISNKTKEKKEKIHIDIKDEILLYKQFHDENSRFIYQREKVIINSYNISGNRLTTIKEKIKKLEENDDVIIFIKNIYIELYEWYIVNKNKEKKEKINIDIKEEILLYKQFHDENSRFIYQKEKAIINGYNISGNRLGHIKEKIKKMKEDDGLITFIKNDYIELYNWYIDINDDNNNLNKLKEEILLYKQFHKYNGRFIKRNDETIINGYNISGARLSRIKEKIKNLDETDDVIIFIKNNYIELYEWNIENTTKEKKEKINIDIKEEILLFKQFHNENGRCIKQNETVIINGYNINGQRLSNIKERKIKNLDETDELIIFIKNNYIELYEWYLQYKK